MTWEEMKNVDVRKVDPATLVDIKTIKMDESLSREEKLKQFVEQVKNPYCFRVGDVVVKCVFNEKENAPSLQDCFEQYVALMVQG